MAATPEHQDKQEQPEAKELPSQSLGAETGKQEVVQRALRKLVDREGQGDVASQFTAMMGMVGNPLHHKMNAEHISQALNLAVQHDEREYNLTSKKLDIDASSRWFKLAVFFVLVIAILVIVVLFRDKPDVLIPLATGVGGLASGFAAGWGYSKASGE